VAVRGEGADFLALTSQLAHFCRTLVSSTTVLSLLHGLEQAWRTGDPNPAGISSASLPPPLFIKSYQSDSDARMRRIKLDILLYCP
jgi:hypothetical protein